MEEILRSIHTLFPALWVSVDKAVEKPGPVRSDCIRTPLVHNSHQQMETLRPVEECVDDFDGQQIWRIRPDYGIK